MKLFMFRFLFKFAFKYYLYTILIMNTFGGNWTENKIELLVEYAKAYLTIMNVHAKQFGWKLMYFDGFAGSGLIVKGDKENRKEIIGAARRIIEIEEP